MKFCFQKIKFIGTTEQESKRAWRSLHNNWGMFVDLVAASLRGSSVTLSFTLRSMSTLGGMCRPTVLDIRR